MFLVLVAVIVILIIIASQSGNSPRDAAFSRYLAYFSPKVNGVQVTSFVRASRPTNFTADMSARVVGASPYYQTDINTSSQPGGSGSRPVPYPSHEIWCALLTGSGGQKWIVFDVLHEDIYNADWLIHESPAPWPNNVLRATLDTIGCAIATP